MRFLVDANVLIYARETKAEAKRRMAIDWLAELARREMMVVNLQVLNEVSHAALRKLGAMSASDVRDWVSELRVFGDSPIDLDVVDAAWEIRIAYRLSWFDCLVLSSADALGCSHVLTEDMGAPRRVGPLTLINPFGASPDAILSAG